ncbi:MAG: polysaccharide biosynthesis protein [Bacteroidales bacterium]|nr:polysaccharide biosynthesis protein [Candidatus Colicola equi]
MFRIYGDDKRIAKNTIWLYARMALIMFINLITVRFLRSETGLGVEGYGVYNAINGVINLIVCLNTVLATASQRFFSVRMGENDEAGLRNIFRISVRISWLMAAVAVVLFETVGLWFVINKMNYPAEWFMEVMVIYQAAIVAFVALLIQVPYLAAVMAHERMGVFAIVTFIGAVLNLVLAFVLRYIPVHHLMVYGIGWMGTAVLSTVLFILYAQRHFVEAKKTPITNKSEYRSLLSFTGWTMFGSLAGAVMIQGNTLLINTYVGPIANAAFAVAVQIYFAVSQLGNNVFVAVRPQMIQTYAQTNYSATKRLFWLSTLIVLVLLILVALPVAIWMPQILTLWLGEVDVLTIALSRWMLLFAVILSLSVPITTILEAAGKVKEYHLPVELSILLSVPVSWILLANGASVMVVAYALTGGVTLAHIVRLMVMKKYAYK